MNRSIVFFTIVAFAALAVSCGNNETKKNPDSTSNASVSASVNGDVLFEQKCIVCHGADGKQGTMGAADLSTSKLDHGVVVSIIKSGKNSMKAFGPELNDAQIEAVATYAESLRK